MDCEEPIAFHEGEKVFLWGTHLFEFKRHKDGGGTLSLTLLAYRQELSCQ